MEKELSLEFLRVVEAYQAEASGTSGDFAALTTPLPMPGIPTPRTDTARAEQNVDWITPTVVEEATRLLAEYIGPIAHIVVERTASRCRDVDGLYAALSLEIESAKDREAFVSLRPKKRA